MYRIINDTAVDEKTTTLIKDYVGLSTDTKPTDVTEEPLTGGEECTGCE